MPQILIKNDVRCHLATSAGVDLRKPYTLLPPCYHLPAPAACSFPTSELLSPARLLRAGARLSLEQMDLCVCVCVCVWLTDESSGWLSLNMSISVLQTNPHIWIHTHTHTERITGLKRHVALEACCNKHSNCLQSQFQDELLL